jgi:drug/metabolite transporter (DMT)-like permease
MRKFALLLPIIAGSCWGSAALFIRALYDAGFDNVTITFSRQMVTSTILAIYIFIFNKKLFKISKRDIPAIALIAIVGYFGLNLCFNYSANMLSMSLASVLLCTAPVFVIIFSKILFGENITKTKALCMVAALVGCALLSGVFEDGGLKWSLFGIAMGVGSSICNAGYTMATNQAVDVRGCHPTTVLFYASSIAMILMIPMTDFGDIGGYLMEAPVNHGLFYIAHASVTSLVPNLVFALAFRYVDSGSVSILSSGAEPTAAMIFGFVFYNEVPTLIGITGMIITITSMVMLTRNSRQIE